MVVVDHDTGRLVWAAADDRATLQGFFDLLGPERASKIRLVSADAAEWIGDCALTACENAYQVDPPSGGDHLAAPASAGSYRVGNVPADGNLVHSLEHGFVILWHRPDLADAQLDQMLDVAEPYARDVLVVPRASLPTPVAATAWHKRLQCPSLELDVLRRFVDEFRNDGPENVPHWSVEGSGTHGGFPGRAFARPGPRPRRSRQRRRCVVDPAGRPAPSPRRADRRPARSGRPSPPATGGPG
jgi:hypothetical protein